MNGIEGAPTAGGSRYLKYAERRKNFLTDAAAETSILSGSKFWWAV